MSASDKAALAALEKHGGAMRSTYCMSCESPWLEEIDKLLRLAPDLPFKITRNGMYNALKEVCPEYPRSLAGFKRHLENCRAEQSEDGYRAVPGRQVEYRRR